MSTAATAMASGYAAGYIGALPESPLLPRGRDHDRALAVRVLDRLCTPAACPPPRLRLITRAPWSAAQMIPFATFDATPPPFASRTRTGRMRTPGAAPAMPSALLTWRGDDAGDVGAVTVRVDATVAAGGDVVHAGQHGTREILVVGPHSGVDDRHRDAAAAGDTATRTRRRPGRAPTAGPGTGRSRRQGVDGPVGVDAQDLRARPTLLGVIDELVGRLAAYNVQLTVGVLGDDPCVRGQILRRSGALGVAGRGRSRQAQDHDGGECGGEGAARALRVQIRV